MILVSYLHYIHSLSLLPRAIGTVTYLICSADCGLLQFRFFSVWNFHYFYMKTRCDVCERATEFVICANTYCVSVLACDAEPPLFFPPLDNIRVMVIV